MKDKAPVDVIIIPARMESKRLPGKPMLMVGGKALVEWTYLRAKRVGIPVVVTTPDREIGQYCQEHNMTWIPSADHHFNGTSRCHEAVDRMTVKVRRVINWQVDEPFVEPEDVKRMLEGSEDRFQGRKLVRTLVHSKYPGDMPGAVKVLYSDYFCHWFTRYPIPIAGLHIGVYGYSKDVLQSLFRMVPSEHSKRESLEQLTWLEQGAFIKPIVVERACPSINTLNDWEIFCGVVGEYGEEITLLTVNAKDEPLNKG